MAEVQSVRAGANRWPIGSWTFWCGVLAGVGIGLLLGAALVELELLTPQRKAWVSVLGIILFWAGSMVAGIAGRRGRAGVVTTGQTESV